MLMLLLAFFSPLAYYAMITLDATPCPRARLLITLGAAASREMLLRFRVEAPCLRYTPYAIIIAPHGYVTIINITSY